MTSSSSTSLPSSVTHAIGGFLATCSQWLSDARLVLAHRHDVATFKQSATFETLLETLAMTERGPETGAPAFVAATLFPNVVRRLGFEVQECDIAQTEDECASCARWRTCRAWGLGHGNDADWRSFCAHAARFGFLPQPVR